MRDGMMRGGPVKPGKADMPSRKDQLKSLLLAPLAEAAPEQKAALPPQVSPPSASTPSETPPVATPVAAPLPRAVSGSVKAMGLSLDRLGAAAEEAERLRAELARAEQVIEIEPARIAPSFLSDRMADADGAEWGAGDPDFVGFVEDIRAHGQQTPILVRPHPDGGGGYQIAYGHRRWRAALLLGRKVRAVLRPLSDAELVVAQGQENAQRRNLSFIEKAFFARMLDERGFDRATLVAALAVQTAEVTRLLQVARAIPAEIARAIGPAPKAGRPRWMAFAEGLGERAALSRVTTVLAAARTRALTSDARFQRAFSVLKPPAKPAPRATSKPATKPVQGARGEPLGTLSQGPDGAALVLDGRLPPAFALSLAAQLPALFARWQAETARKRIDNE